MIKLKDFIVGKTVWLDIRASYNAPNINQVKICDVRHNDEPLKCGSTIYWPCNVSAIPVDGSHGWLVDCLYQYFYTEEEAKNNLMRTAQLGEEIFFLDKNDEWKMKVGIIKEIYPAAKIRNEIYPYIETLTIKMQDNSLEIVPVQNCFREEELAKEWERDIQIIKKRNPEKFVDKLLYDMGLKHGIKDWVQTSEELKAEEKMKLKGLYIEKEMYYIDETYWAPTKLYQIYSAIIKAILVNKSGKIEILYDTGKWYYTSPPSKCFATKTEAMKLLYKKLEKYKNEIKDIDDLIAYGLKLGKTKEPNYKTRAYCERAAELGHPIEEFEKEKGITGVWGDFSFDEKF